MVALLSGASPSIGASRTSVQAFVTGVRFTALEIALPSARYNEFEPEDDLVLTTTTDEVEASQPEMPGARKFVPGTKGGVSKLSLM